MNKKNSVYTKIQQWIIKQSEKTDEIYKLDSSGELPELGELKMAHFRLLKRYVYALGTVEKLSLFINFYEYEKSSRQPSLGRLFFYILNKIPPFSLITLQPILVLLIESHIKIKLQELKHIYIQTRSSVPYYYLNGKEYRDWLGSTADECDEFSKTLSLSGNITTFFGSLSNALTITGIAAILIKLFSSPYNMALFAIAIIFISITSVNFFAHTFLAKRDIFLLSEDEDVYSLENKLFKLLNREKKRELAIDHLSFGLLFFPLLIVLKLTFKVDNLFMHLSLLIVYILSTIYCIHKRNETKTV